MKNGCPINQSDRFSFSVSHPPWSNRHIVKVLLEDMIAENCKMECHVIHIPMRASVCLSSKVSRNLQLHRCLIYPSACLPLVLQESQNKERKLELALAIVPGNPFIVVELAKYTIHAWILTSCAPHFTNFHLNFLAVFESVVLGWYLLQFDWIFL